MNDLTLLVGGTPGESPRKSARSAQDEAAALRRMVGDSSADEASRETTAADVASAAEGLRAFVGGGPSAGGRARRASADATSTEALRALIGEPLAGLAGEDPRPLTANVAGKRRWKVASVGNSGVDWITAAVATVAAIAVVAVVVLAMAKQNGPLEEAVASLQQQEIGLANETATAQTAIDLYRESVVGATALAASAEPVLERLDGDADADALAEASEALERLRAALDRAPVEPTVPVYARPTPSPADVDDVARALDTVRQADEGARAATAAARSARAGVTDAAAVFTTALAGLGQAIDERAPALAAAYGAAAASFRDEVRASAREIVTAQASGDPGVAALAKYADAVAALRADNVRAVNVLNSTRSPSVRTPVNPAPASPAQPVQPQPPVEPEPEPPAEPEPVDPIPPVEVVPAP